MIGRSTEVQDRINVEYIAINKEGVVPNRPQSGEVKNKEGQREHQPQRLRSVVV